MKSVGAYQAKTHLYELLDEALPLATRDQILATAAKRCGVPLK